MSHWLGVCLYLEVVLDFCFGHKVEILAFNGSKNIKFCKEDDKFESGGQQSDKFEAVKAASREPA